jgi:thiol-disulfide isomerase/thioredoxin
MKTAAAAIAIVSLVAACAQEKNASRPAAKPRAPQKPAATEPAPPATNVGDLMPAYSTEYLGGKRFDLAAEKGNVVLVNLWATWCVPCRYEIPELQSLHNRYASSGFKVIGVSVDESGADDVKQFVSEEKITYPIALDAEGHLANVLQTTVLPTSVMIDRSGRIVWRKVGALTPNEIPALDALVKRTLGGQVFGSPFLPHGVERRANRRPDPLTTPSVWRTRLSSGGRTPPERSSAGPAQPAWCGDRAFRGQPCGDHAGAE